MAGFLLMSLWAAVWDSVLWLVSPAGMKTETLTILFLLFLKTWRCADIKHVEQKNGCMFIFAHFRTSLVEFVKSSQSSHVWTCMHFNILVIMFSLWIIYLKNDLSSSVYVQHEMSWLHNVLWTARWSNCRILNIIWGLNNIKIMGLWFCVARY